MGNNIGQIDAATMREQAAAFHTQNRAFLGSQAKEVYERAGPRIAVVAAELERDLDVARDAIDKGDMPRAEQAIYEAHVDASALSGAFVTQRDGVAAAVDYRKLREKLTRQSDEPQPPLEPKPEPEKPPGGNMQAHRSRLAYRQRMGELPSYGQVLPETLRNDRLRPEQETLFPKVDGYNRRAAPLALSFERINKLVTELVDESVRDAQALATVEEVEAPLSEVHADSLNALEALDAQMSILGDLLGSGDISRAMRALDRVGAFVPDSLSMKQEVLAWEFHGADRSSLDELNRISQDLGTFAGQISSELTREQAILDDAVQRSRRRPPFAFGPKRRPQDSQARRYRKFSRTIRREMKQEQKILDEVRALQDVVWMASQRLGDRQREQQRRAGATQP